MRKLTLLTLLAAILCLPQMVMAEKYTPTFYFSSISTLESLVVGESYDASQDLKNLSGVTPVTWSTSDPAIVSVDENGIITVHQTGSVTLYAHSDESTYFYEANAQKELNITTYPLSVLKEGGWVDVTPSTASNIDGAGKVSYDYSTHTLTLNNWTNDFTSITDFSNYIGSAIIYILDNQPLTIRLIGTNTITCGEFCSANTLIFSGADAAQDKLIVNSTNHAAISVSNQLTIDNASLVLSETLTNMDPYQNFTDYGVFWADKLSVINGGNFHATVTPTTDLSSCGSCLAVGVVSSTLVGNILTKHVIWSNDPANEDDINYYYKTNADDFIGCFFDDQGNAMLPYEVEISSNAPVGPTPSGESITWEERQVSHVSLYDYEVGKTQKSPLIKNIFVSLTRESEGSGTSCRFAEKYLAIDNCGELKFQSVAGDIQGIVINGSNTYADNLSADWTYDDVANTLTWAGTASDEVTLSGYIYFDISSIEFTYTPASAPRLGEIINGFYEITGAHTAKVITAAGTIPDSIVDDEVTYYITEIGDYAYYNDPTEGYFYFGANIAKVGAHAFEGCSRAIEFTFYSTVLDEIGDEAFKDCKLLGWLNFDTQMPPVLGSNAFSGDGFLNHINVYPSSSVLNDYKAAAGWSTYADKITLSYPFPATVGEQFFFDNQNTTNIYAVSSVSPKEIKVMPYTAEVNALYPITRTGTLIIPEEAAYLNTGFSVTGIGANAYKDSARFDVVMIPQAVKSIEAGAFLNCTGVENVFFLWNDPTTVTWYDGDKGLEFKTATNGGTKIFVPEGTLAAYQAWAPAWAGCMYEGGILEVDATAGQDPDKTTRYYRTFFDSSKDYMMPPSVWAYVGYVRNNEFILHPIAFDGDIVPAGTAVVLESETPTYSLIAMDPEASPYTGTNDLIGSDVAFPRADLGADADKVYVLGKSATIGTDCLIGMGLYRYTGTTLGAHKAYLIYDGAGSGSSNQQNAPARFLFKHENEATGVENVQSDKVQCTKVIRDGQLIIIKDGKEYNAQGLIIK